MKKINTKKKKYNEHSSVLKQSSLANLRKITFIIFECHRSIAKSIDFYFFLLSVKQFMTTKSSAVEIQNLLMNPKSRPI